MHLMEACPRSRSCLPCEITFDSREELRGHLKYACEYVEVKCTKCQVELTRKDFCLHQCYIDQTVIDLAIRPCDLFEQNVNFEKASENLFF